MGYSIDNDELEAIGNEEVDETEEVVEDGYESEDAEEPDELVDEEVEEIDEPEPSYDVDPDYETYRQVKPMMDSLRQDEIMKEYVGHKANGHNPGDIVDGMFLKRHPELEQVIRSYYSQGNQQQARIEEEVPEFDNYNDEVRYYARKEAETMMKQFMAQVAPQLQTVAQKQQAIEQQGLMNQVRDNNDSVMRSALMYHGLDEESLTEPEIRQIASTMQSLYPGVKFQQAALTPEQAKYIIAASLGGKKRKQPDMSALSRQSQLPRINPSGSSRGTSTGSLTVKVDGLTKTERKNRLQDLF